MQAIHSRHRARRALAHNITFRIFVALAFVLSSLLFTTNRAYAYCSGLSSYVGRWESGGIQNVSSGLSGTTGYVQGFNPDPTVSNSTAWYMVTIPGQYTYAQTGWVRTSNWSTYYHYAAWRSGYNDSQHEAIDYVTPTNSHNYGVQEISGGTSFEFSYNFSAWLDTANLGWYPTQVEAAAETLNHGDHFPGSASPGPYVEFWGGTYTIYGLGYSVSLTMYDNNSSTDVVGKTQLSSTAFYVWDKRCSDGG